MKLLALLLLALVLIPTVFVIGSLFVPTSTMDPSGTSPGASPSSRAFQGDDLLDTELASPRSESGRDVVPQEASAVAAGRPTPSALTDQSGRRAKAEKLIREQTLARASKLAEQVGIDAKGEKILADLLVQQRERYQDLQARITALPREERKQALRDGNKEFRAWYAGQLGAHFDARTIEKLHKPYAKANDATALEGDGE